MPTDTFFNLPEDKRQRVLDVALDEFAEHPYARASISNIAREAGVAKGSMYQYFDSKKELFFYLVDLASETKVQFLSGAGENIDWNDFFGGYEALVLAATEFELKNPLHAKLLQHAVESHHVEELFGELKQTSAAFLSPLLETAATSGQLRSDVPLDMLLYFMNSVTTEFGRYLANKAGFSDWTAVVYEENLEKVLALDLEKHVHDMIEVLRSGMGADNNE